MFKKQKQQQQFRKGNNRWADDDDNNNSSSGHNNYNNNSNFSNQSKNVPSFIKKSNPSSSSNYNNYNQQNNYQSSNNTSGNIRKDTRFALEKKLIDDILQPTGIKIKPDEKLMIDFCRRAKNLDRTLIYTYLMEKISPYKTYVGNNENTNMLIKCLYLISYIVDSKIQDLFEVFLDNQQIFEDIKAALGRNRRVSELVDQILQLLGVEVNQRSGNDYQNFENNNLNNNNQNEQPTSQVNNNANLLDFDTGDKVNNNNTGNIDLLEDIFQGSGNNNNTNNGNMNIQMNNNNNTNDLLGGIFGNNNNMNNNQNNNSNNAFPADIFGISTQPQTNNNLNNNQNLFFGNQTSNNNNNQNSFFDNISSNNTNNNLLNNNQNNNSNQNTNQPKGFNFIKSKDSNTSSTNDNKTQPKKGFSFIKQSNNTNNNNNNNNNNNFSQPISDLNDIFSNMPQNNNNQSNNNTNSFNFINNTSNMNSNINTSQLENIFNMQSNNNNNNLMNNQDNNNMPTLVPEQPKFNIEQVYENTEQLKQGNKSKDPFNFVDDLLKK